MGENVVIDMKREIHKKEWAEKIPDRLEDLWIFAGICFVGILWAVVVWSGEYTDRLAKNRYLLLFVLAFFGLAGGVYIFLKSKGQSRKTVAHPVLWLAVGYLFLYAVQLIWVNNVYFYTGWDVGLMRERAEWIINGGSIQGLSIDAGYSVYPNNLVLFYVFCLIEKCGTLFSMEEPYLLCIYLSCLCVDLSCFLGGLVLRRFTESGVVYGCYLLVSTVSILFSPWIMIPYSDTFGMFFVMLGLWGLVCVEQKYLRWVVTAFATVIGYQIKPSCLFLLFAVYMVFGVRYFFSLRKRWKELLFLVLCTVVFRGIGLLMPLWVQHTYSFQLIPEMEITPIHYLMMGWNEETNGAFNGDDFWMSTHIPDLETREQTNKEEFVRRFEALREEKKLGEFLRAKALVNFNDGTFGWTKEGEFFKVRIEHDNMLWDWFCSTYVPPGVWENDGKYYPLFRTVAQTFWLLMLTGMLFVGFGRKKSRSQRACMMIVVCGLFAFVMLFEARARYIYLYSPLFLILSLVGYEEAWSRLAATAEKLRPIDKTVANIAQENVEK